MTIDEMKAAHLRMINEVAHGGRLEVLDELYAENCVWHGPGGDRLVGPEALKQSIGAYRTGFPGFRITVHHQFGQGDHLATRWSVVGRHDGPLGELPATGKEIDITAMTITRFEGGRIAEEWELFDEGLMMRQLGVADG